MPDFEYRFAPFEFRQMDEGLGVIEGTIIRYGDIATFPWGTEEFKAGAFGDFSNRNVRANRMHQRDQALGNTLEAKNLVITNTDKEMSARLELPNTSYGRDTAVEVGQRILTGLSLEFRSTKDTIDDSKQHRTIETAMLGGFGVVDAPAYPGSVAQKRWEEHRSGIVIPGKELADNLGIVEQDKVEGLRYTEFPLDLEYENRQVGNMRLVGRLPYGVDGITSMARGERVRFLPGAFGDSLAGEIVLLAGNNYDDVLAANGDGGQLRLRESDDALEFEARRLPRTQYSEDFAEKLNLGLVKGITAGWALAGSETSSEDLPDGGTRITVEKAMLCELRLRTRSSYPGESIAARPRRRESLRFQVV